MQLALGSHEWPEGEQLRVRMGIHTGEVSEVSTGLVGYEVHRAARIAAVGHGGQILLSSAAAAIVEDSLPANASLRDLGAHRLKDLGRPETIFQLVAEGLTSQFPPLRSLDNPELVNNLPTSLNTFIGRATELAELRALVLDSRLVTLTGAGGSGKTRLALQLAAELLDGTGEGVWFVELATVSDPEQVSSTVMTTLQVRPEGETTPLDSLAKLLRNQNILIVLDNCEHVIDAVAKLADVLGRTCPRVSLMVTSREPLGIDGERVYRVRSLSLPDESAEDSGDVQSSDAVGLFVARALAHDSTFELDETVAPLVASVCRRLDGIPLAIELAASRLSSMSLDDLHERLDQRFRLLTGGSRNALPRQQTLAATVAWSYDLLNEPERDLLRRLSVFVGGFDLKAAEAVCAGGGFESFEVADLLSSLVNKSLVTAERASTSLRYRLLETIRQYAADQLVQVGGEAETLRVRQLHAEYYLKLCREAARELEGVQQCDWLRRLDLEYDNILATFTTLSADVERTSDMLELANGLFRFVATRRNSVIPLHLIEALSRDVPVDVALRAHGLLRLSVITAMNEMGENYLRRASDLNQEALELAEQIGDPDFTVRVHCRQSMAMSDLGQKDLGRESAATALELARSINSPRGIGEALFAKAYCSEQPITVRQETLESLSLLRQIEDTYMVTNVLVWLSMSCEDTPEGLREAWTHNREASDLAERLGSTYHRIILRGNGSIYAFLIGEFETSMQLARQSLHLSRRSGSWVGVDYFTYWILACCAAQRGDFRVGAQLLGAHEAIEEHSKELLRGYWSRKEIEARDRNRALLRDQLGSEEFERAVAVGRAMNPDAAYELAMGRIEPVG